MRRGTNGRGGKERGSEAGVKEISGLRRIMWK